MTINRMYGDMVFTVTRPNDSKLNAIVEVTHRPVDNFLRFFILYLLKPFFSLLTQMNLDRILTAVLLFKGLLIEWVVIRGFREKTGKKSPDLWTESNYQVRSPKEVFNGWMLKFIPLKITLS